MVENGLQTRIKTEQGIHFQLGIRILVMSENVRNKIFHKNISPSLYTVRPTAPTTQYEP